jgi:hypothetical protein
MHRKTLTLFAAAALAATTSATALAAPGHTHHGHTPRARAATTQAAPGTAVSRRTLTPSSDQLAQCMPGAQVRVTLESSTDQTGFDKLRIHARRLPPNRDYTLFLLQTAGPPFGAAQYSGDITTDAHGRADNEIRLIVDEAFASTIVNNQRTRVELNQIGMWFADPADDDFCLGPNSPTTPFDGDNEAGVQAFNSAHTTPLPAP